MSPCRSFHESADRVFAELEETAPGAPLAFFGQTVFWDEPMKRILLEARDASGSQRDALVGIHDLDYFSRMPVGGNGEYRVLSHNDVTTRELWSAAGELSALFGCEVWPTREELNELNLRLNVALGPALKGLEEVTETWGWRAVARAGGDAAVVNELPVDDVLPALCELLEWGVEESATCLADADARQQALKLGRSLVKHVRDAAASRSVRSVSDLFVNLLSFVWDLVGTHTEAEACPAPAKSDSRTSEVFRLTPQFASLPRFRLLDLFLDPETATAAREAYDRAVENVPMYALEEFGTGAIPFDLYVPGRGRGTLFVMEGHVVAHTNPRTVIEVERPVCTAECLAKAIDSQLGNGAAVIGKAVALAAMMASEFVFVLNETGSAYVDRTARLVRELRNGGLHFPVYPVLRVRYHTWDALRHVKARFRLPDHLCQAFGTREIAAGDFARRWRQAVREQEQLLKRLRELRGAADILSFLGHEKQQAWFDRLLEYQEAQSCLLRIQHESAGLKREAERIRTAENTALEAFQALERRRGQLNRDRVKPLRKRFEEAESASERKRLEKELAAVEDEHAQAVAEMEAKRDERRSLAAERRRLTQAFRKLERSDQARRARQVVGEVERAAERQRLEIARNAILASHGLPHTEVRPSAWWLPLVDPTGKWYEGVRRTTEFRLERLDEDA